MNAAQAAYWNLVSLAATDGQITSAERAALEQYRQALRLTPQDAKDVEDELARSPGGTFRIDGSPEERIFTLRMMACVAWADGVLSEKERARLERVAAKLGVGPAQFADLLVSAERESAAKGRGYGAVLATAFALTTVALAAWIIVHRAPSPAPATDVSKERSEVAELRARLDDMAKKGAEEDARRVQDAQQAMERAERELADRVQELEKRVSQPSAPPDLVAQLASLRAELEKRRESVQGFKEVQKRCDASVLFVYTYFVMVKGTQREVRGGSGTGFFVTPSGYIATNKHVLQPWKFEADLVRYLRDGYTVDEKSIIYAVWPAGSNAKREDGTLDLSTAWHTQAKSLSLVALPPDHMEEHEGKLSDGTSIKARFHGHDDNDLALLKANVGKPVPDLPLCSDVRRIEKLDPVMVLGFPQGLELLESRRAETSPSLGEVRKAEDKVWVTAPIVHGNSGGPVLNLRGEVIGVSTWFLGDATLGGCIQTKHLLRLLPLADALLKEAREFEKSGALWAALDDLRLASDREPGKDQQKEIAEMRARLLAQRDERLAKAKALADQGDREGARKAYQAVFDSFRDVWARAAADALSAPR